jgi:GT2 family glycosyltransferase
VEPLIAVLKEKLKYPVVYHRCKHQGAAIQRNEAAELVKQDIILFMDDDVYMEQGCLERMMQVLEKDSKKEIGGVGIILTNQHYRQPSRLFKKWLDFMAGEKADSYAGRVIGPALNFLPSPSNDGRVIEVEWLNTTCTAYRREAFETERFSCRFYGYSLLEDVHLSLRIGKKWKLVVATSAKAFHDSQPSHFKHPFQIGKMGVVNRYLIMTEILEKKSSLYKLKFLLSVLFGLFTSSRNIRSIKDFMSFLFLCSGTMYGLSCIALKCRGRK